MPRKIPSTKPEHLGLVLEAELPRIAVNREHRHELDRKRLGNDLHGALDQVRRLRGRLAGAALRVGARDVEVAQNDVIEAVRVAGVAQHYFAHQLRPAVRRNRL